MALRSKWILIGRLSAVFIMGFYALAPLVPLWIIATFDSPILSIKAGIGIIIYLLCHVGLCMYLFFRHPSAVFMLVNLVASKIFYLHCTTKGEALTREDFQELTEKDENLFIAICTQRCRGYCISICYRICQCLKKGAIEVAAVRRAQKLKDDDPGEPPYFLHVFYVYGDWCFDPNSVLQFRVTDLHDLYDAKVYKTYSFADIGELDYNEFYAEEKAEFAEWCEQNNCSMFTLT